ncbi:Tn3 family transposase [Streptomyces sp. NBC_00114]|uniref:Tn3 family transposase n=1 Tax=Streptomyces sp. NBC_00114 TaxID=2975656 RepID=UPI00225AD5FA|nr:Tn3 family transposase [Streptomyces sp. NBC_00078]
MPVEFLTDAQAAAYAAYDGAPSRTELERFFFLDDADRELIEGKRRSHNRLGFAAQLTTARYLGVFLDDPTGVPPEVVDYLAEQLGIAGTGRPSGVAPMERAGIRPATAIAKSLHILRLADEPGYRRQIKAQANLQEGRHALARKIFHGRSGQLYQRYQDGMEDQLGALGLVLNAVVLFNTRYMDATVSQLRADGFDVRDEDVARLSPFVRQHINMLGRYSFKLPELPGGMRPLRDPDATDEE